MIEISILEQNNWFMFLLCQHLFCRIYLSHVNSLMWITKKSNLDYINYVSYNHSKPQTHKQIEKDVHIVFISIGLGLKVIETFRMIVITRVRWSCRGNWKRWRIAPGKKRPEEKTRVEHLQPVQTYCISEQK